MADLFDRLFPADPSVENISVHYLYSAMVDYAAGYTTRAQIIAYWDLDAEAQIDLNALCDKIDALGTLTSKMIWGEQFHAILMFAEAGAKYDDRASFRARLGL